MKLEATHNTNFSSLEVKGLLLDIRFWILLLFVGRLYGIWFPPLEVEHNWRQTTVTMVARNFLEIDDNIFFPRIDMAGDLTGITSMEFPLLNYLIFLLAKIFGYQHWYGRLIVLITSSLGTWYFYLFIKKYFTEKVAFCAAFMLLFSLWFSHGRKIMPDTFATSLIIMALYYGFEFLEKKGMKNLILYFFFGLAGAMAKLPAIFLFAYLIVPFFKGYCFPFSIRRIWFLVASTLILKAAYWWYFYWTNHLLDTYKFYHFFMGVSYQRGITECWQELGLVLKRLYFTPLGFSGMFLFFGSMIYFIYRKKIQYLKIYFFGLVVFCFVVVFKSGFVFYHHSYYINTYIPVFVLPIALFVSDLKREIMYFLLLIIAIEGVGSQYHEFRVKPDHAKVLDLEKDLDKITQRDDKILINSGRNISIPNPTPMYFAHRKGWVMPVDKFESEEVQNIIKAKKAKAIVVFKTTFGENIDLQLPIATENEVYKIYLNR